MKMNKYECHCADTDCMLESNKQPTYCPNYSHIVPDWQLVNTEVPNLENAVVEVKERWKPEKGNRYWFISDKGFVIFSYWQDDEIDNVRYNFGNVFRTEIQAKQALEKVKKLLLSLNKDNEEEKEKK